MELKTYENVGERVWSCTLKNGLKIFVIPKPGYNKAYAFFATRYGGADRRFKYGGKWIDTPEGVAHFLEHKMFDTKDGNALQELASNGASPNAFTSSGMTAYHFESTENFEKNLRCLLSFVSVPYFTPESVKKEQGIIGQEIRMCEDEPGHAVYYNLLKCLYDKHPVRDTVVGTVDSIAEITADTLYSCHKIFYNPSNMVLCVAGNVEPERIAEIAEEVLPKEPGEVPERDYGEKDAEDPLVKRAEAKMEVSAPIFCAGGKLEPEKGEAFLRQQLAGSIALECLMGSGSELYSRLYSQGLIASDFGFSVDTVCDVAYAVFGGESRDPDRVFEEIKKEAAKTAASGVDRELFRRVKRAEYGEFLRGLNSVDNMCYNYAESWFYGYDFLRVFQVIEDITANDAEEFIARTLGPEHLAISIVGPA